MKTMNRLSQLLRLGALCLGTLLVASACSSKSQDEPKPQPMPTPVPPVVQVDGPAKVVIEIRNGHLHGHRSFHFVPSGGKFTHKDYFNTQRFTFVRQGEKWVLDPASDKRFIGYQVVLFDGTEGSSKPNYGTIVKLYDQAGKELNADYNSDAKRAQYQLLYYPSDVKAWEGETVAFDGKDPKSILKYVYCDTKIWDKPASSQGNSFLAVNDPVGFKGYFQFNNQSQFTLNIDLWMNPAGKLDGDKASDFWTPNAKLAGGKRLLHLELPVSIFGDINFQEEVLAAVDEDFDKRSSAAATDEEKAKVKHLPIPFDMLEVEHQTVAKRLMMLLGATEWTTVCQDMIEYYTTQGAEDNKDGLLF